MSDNTLTIEVEEFGEVLISVKMDEDDFGNLFEVTEISSPEGEFDTFYSEYSIDWFEDLENEGDIETIAEVIRDEM